MPVVVTGADRPLGRAVIDALLAAESTAGSAAGLAEVRATVRDHATRAGLVARGVRTAVTDLTDPFRFGAVLEGAHTVIHLDPGEDPGEDPGSPLRSWPELLEAAEDTGLCRLVTVCGTGCSERVPPPVPPYDLVVVRAASLRPTPALVAALLEADRRREVRGFDLVDVPGRADSGPASGTGNQAERGPKGQYESS